MEEFKKNVKHALPYFKGHGFRIFFILLFTISILVLRIITPIFSAKIIVNLTDNKLDQVISIAILLIVFDLLWDMSWYIQRQLYHKVYVDVFSKVQNDLGSAILRLDNDTLDKNSSGVFIQRLTGDTEKVAVSFERFIQETAGLFTSLGTLIAIFVVSFYAGIYALITMGVSILVSSVRVKEYNKGDKELRKINERTTGFIGELVRGARDIKMLNSEKSFLCELRNKVNYNNNERFKLRTKDRRYWLLGMGLDDLLSDGMIILLVYLLLIDKTTITNALIIRNYQNRISGFASSVGYLIESYKDFNLSCTRIFNIIESDEFAKEKFGDKHLNGIEGNFEFKNVSFGYNKKSNVLNNISFKVDANTTVGFVGKSGEGKSTIFSLLCKLYDVDKGSISIDGININELDKDSIRGNITVISQDPYIFNLSIKDNLKLVKSNLTTSEMKEACKMACLDEFIESLPHKYNTIVGEGGVNLSGGQRQRLAIARAFVQKTEIILFDEATSALDNETQASIQQAIQNLQKDYTILIIAHRLSTIKNCNKILLISDGKVKAEGTHDELLKKSKMYKELYESEIEK